MKKTTGKMLRGVGYLLGLSILVYPLVSAMINDYTASQVVEKYDQEVAGLSTEQEEAMLAAARQYNDQLTSISFTDPFVAESVLPSDEYLDLLSLNSSGMMGYIRIPKIGVKLPIYHGCSEEVLQVGIGHVESSSLPVGGGNTHSVLTGHRGLPSARLFTDLDQMQLGDVFYIKILSTTLAYQVDRIHVVEPTDVGSIQIEEGQDYITLVTCTPYAINTHRLLVRGTRIPYSEGLEQSEEAFAGMVMPLYLKEFLIAAGVLCVVFITLKLIEGRKHRKGASENEQ